jgi:hypothetical protein
MYLLLRIFHSFIPSILKKKGLEELFICTAAAFNQNPPALKGISYNKSLSMYAQFTKDEVEKYILGGGDLLNLQKELNKHAVIFGQKLRKLFSIRTYKKTLYVFGQLYSFIGIDLKFSGNEELSVKKCFFSNYYTPQVCAIVSAIDSGVFEGLSGECRIEFRQRITEGQECCNASILIKDNVA